MNIELGKTYKDVVTGFSGIAMSKVQYLTGCDQVGLNPGMLPDGKLGDTTYFDWTRLEEDKNVPICVLPGMKKTTTVRKNGGINRDAPGKQA